MTFVFAVIGTKLLVALWAIYYLFPGGRSCPACDAETIPIQMSFAHRLFGALFFLGKVRRRWCLECAWDGFARRPSGYALGTADLPTPHPVDSTN